MKKIILLGCIFAISYYSIGQVRQILDAAKPKKAFTGTPVLAKKSSVSSLSLGAPNKLADFLTFGGVASIVGKTSDKKSFGPLMLDYEYLISDNIGLGASLLVASASSNYRAFGQDYSGDITQFQLGLSSYYHLYTTDKLDPYIKATLGINLWNGQYKDNNNDDAGNFVAPTPFGLRSIVGLRYFINEKFAVLGEGAVVLSPNFNVSANIGAAYKL